MLYSIFLYINVISIFIYMLYSIFLYINVIFIFLYINVIFYIYIDYYLINIFLLFGLKESTTGSVLSIS